MFLASMLRLFWDTQSRLYIKQENKQFSVLLFPFSRYIFERPQHWIHSHPIAVCLVQSNTNPSTPLTVILVSSWYRSGWGSIGVRSSESCGPTTVGPIRWVLGTLPGVKAAWASSWPLNVVVCQGYECVELCLSKSWDQTTVHLPTHLPTYYQIVFLNN